VLKDVKAGKIVLKIKGKTDKDFYFISSTKEQQAFLKYINNKSEYWAQEFTYIKRTQK
jgi:hypothetical protein